MKQPHVKVLQIIDSLGMGGAETWLMEVVRHWSKTGIGRMDFLATSGQPGIFDAEAQQLGAKVHYLRYGRTYLPQFIRQFRKILQEAQYDAIHDHQDYSSGWHFLMGANKLPPVRVTHVHNPSYQIRNNYGVTRIRRFTARVGMELVGHYATHLAGTSRQVLTEYGFDATRFQRIPKGALHCGFNTERFVGDAATQKAKVCLEFGWPEDAKIVLFAGRMDGSPNRGHPQNHKNSGFAIDVGIKCVRLDDRVRMILAGKTTPAVEILEQRIASSGLSERIRFVGIRNDIERLMLASDVLFFPSRGEGLGMVAVEAQAAALPVLASDAVPRECVVIPELVRFQSLEASETMWAVELLQLTTQSRNILDANRRVAASPFSIESSATTLFKLYSDGTLS